MKNFPWWAFLLFGFVTGQVGANFYVSHSLFSYGEKIDLFEKRISKDAFTMDEILHRTERNEQRIIELERRIGK